MPNLAEIEECVAEHCASMCHGRPTPSTVIGLVHAPQIMLSDSRTLGACPREARYKVPSHWQRPVTVGLLDGAMHGATRIKTLCMNGSHWNQGD